MLFFHHRSEGEIAHQGFNYSFNPTDWHIFLFLGNKKTGYLGLYLRHRNKNSPARIGGAKTWIFNIDYESPKQIIENENFLKGN